MLMTTNLDTFLEDKFKASPSYEEMEQSSENIGARSVRKYILRDELPATVISAVDLICSLLSSETFNFYRTFPVEKLDERVASKKYLTINGSITSGFALCLAKRVRIAVAIPNFKNEYFSGTFLKEPVECTQGHYLEKRHALIWKEGVGDRCPAGNHPLGDLKEDGEELQRLKNDIKSFKLDEKKKALKDDELIKRIERTERRQDKNDIEILTLEGKKVHLFELTEAGCKVVFKVGAYTLTKESPKLIAKVLGKSALKKIPFISLLAGVVFAGMRFYRGEKLKAVGELASGITAMIPYAGTFVSVAIDLALLSSDVTHPRFKIDMDLEKSCKVLGIELTKDQPDANKVEVDEKYKKNIVIFHPDKKHLWPEGFDGPKCKVATQLLNDAKAYLYKEYDWK